MYGKLLIVVALAAVVLAREYPPGVHPAVCPNFPLCDLESLTKFTLDGQPIPEWMYNPSILPVAPVDPNAKTPTAAAPALAPAPLRLSLAGTPIPEWLYRPDARSLPDLMKANIVPLRMLYI